MRLAVLGAGAWGSAVAKVAAAQHDVCIWVRDAQQAAQIQRTRINTRYLPDVDLGPALNISADLSTAIAGAQLVIVATPTNALRATAQALVQHACQAPLLWLCKGFEPHAQQGALLAHEVLEQVYGTAFVKEHAGALSGPSFAQEVAQGLPAALTVAGSKAFCELVTEALHQGPLRIYSSQDVVGVEVGGAVKNVLAIATGVADALALGQNARAALITRGLAEITRLGLALGAQASTFMGLAGVGDLILTCTGALSRNRQVGLLLGQGVTLAQALAQLGHVAEGVHSAPAVLACARVHGIDMPITAAVCELLAGRSSPRALVDALMARDPKAEQSHP